MPLAKFVNATVLDFETMCTTIGCGEHPGVMIHHAFLVCAADNCCRNGLAIASTVTIVSAGASSRTNMMHQRSCEAIHLLAPLGIPLLCYHNSHTRM